MGIFSPSTGVTAASGNSASLPGMQNAFETELGRNMFVFSAGIFIILFGVFLAKKLKLINSVLLSKEDQKLIDRTKRVLGFGSSNQNYQDIPGQRSEQ